MTRLMLAIAIASSLMGCVLLMDKPEPWACDVDADCSAENHCVTGQCVYRSKCTYDRNCAEGSFCSRGICRVKECVEVADPYCGGYLCSTSLWSCETTCSSDDSCTRGYTCSNNQCVVAACDAAKTAQCGGYRCLDGTCGTWCESNADCEGSLTCGTSHLCECSINEQCGGFLCETNLCARRCTGTCAAGYHCVSSRCEPDIP